MKVDQLLRRKRPSARTAAACTTAWWRGPNRTDAGARMASRSLARTASCHRRVHESLLRPRDHCLARLGRARPAGRHDGRGGRGAVRSGQRRIGQTGVLERQRQRLPGPRNASPGARDGTRTIHPPVCSPQSNGMAESFVNTFKRHYVNTIDRSNAEAVLAQLPDVFTHFNEVHPHSSSKWKSLRMFRRELARRAQENGAN